MTVHGPAGRRLGFGGVRRRNGLLLATTALMPLSASLALGNPLGGQVVGGSATISTPNPSTVTVTQTSPSAIINWNTFNIGAGQTTQFIQPGASSVILDRVTGGLGPSQINGSISANGTVYLVNPNGILFGPTSAVNAAGFLATTHDIANSDFMAGRYNFSVPGNPAASIVNQGSITAASGGFAALVAPGVRNSGTITATLGTVGLAAANGFTLDFYGDKLITLAVSDSIANQVTDVASGKPLSSLVTNTGKLSASGGKVQLTAAAARTVVDSVINTSGVIEANSVGTKNGMIVLSAATGASKPAGAPTQTIKIAGGLSASGKSAGQTGGKISVTAENIALAGATLDASGAAGGGTVSIGGKGTAWTATTVTADWATTIDASALQNGNGGSVVLWADQLTTFAGLIKATGGAQGGNGGTVETSGGTVNFAGIQVNTSAPAGTTGNWLVDPTNLTVDAAAATTINTNLATTNVTLQTTSGGASGPGVQSSGPGDIIVNAPISWSSANTLSLLAYNAITVNAGITITGAGGLVLTAAANPLAPAAPLISFGGSVQFSGTPNSGQSLSINNQPFKLLYSMSDVQNINATSASLAANYALAKPLDATSVASWKPIGTDGAGNILNSGNGFTGAFQGLGNKISNLTINLPSTNYVGLLGYVGSSGVIQNLGVVGGIVSGTQAVGELVGFNNGAVSQSYATGSVNGSALVGGLVGHNFGTVLQSYATGPVGGSDPGGGYVGGLVGGNQGTGTVLQSYATGAVTANSNEVGGLIGSNNSAKVANSYATGAVTGHDAVGGLVGQSYGGAQISQSYATGTVSGSQYVGGLVGFNGDATVSQSYATGAVNGSSNVGGLAGYNQGTISASYWDTTINPNLSGVGTNTGTSSATGLTTAQFGNVANFSSWNFGTTPGGPTCSTGGACWVIVDADGSLNNTGGAAGATRPMLLSEWSTNIANAHQLQLMALDPTANYTLANNVNLGPALANPADVWGPNGSAGFVPIGNSTTNFTGTFNGQGNTISNLTINLPSSNNVGLFGYVGAKGTIQNVGLVGAGVSGDSVVGSLIGNNAGTVTNASATGSVTAGGSGVLPGAGGLIGNNSGTVTSAYAAVTVTAGSGSSTDVGGLVGDNYGTITQSHATGSVSGGEYNTGGLVGGNGGTVTQSYATGAVSGGLNSVAGGLVGYNFSAGSITQSYATGTVIGGVAVGGLAGLNDGSITQSYAAGAVSWAGTTGTAFGIGGLVGGNDGTIAQTYATGAVGGVATTGTATGTGGLIGYNFGGGTVTNAYATGAVTGGGSSYDVGGLVGYNTGTVTNTYATGAVTGYSAVGGLVGYNTGTVAQSYATGKVHGTGGDDVGGLVGYNPGGTVTQSYATGNVSGPLDLGGLVGDNSNGTVKLSYATGTVSGTNNSSDFGVGGLVGFMYGGSVTQSYATGPVSAPAYVGGLVGWSTGTITQSYSAGAVTGTSNVGGFLGFNGGGATITQSYWDITTSGFGIHNGVGNQTDAAGVTGLTTAQMQDLSSFQTTYAGWDFQNVWAPPNQAGQGGLGSANYPQLYALTPVVWSAASNASRTYGSANPTFTGTTYGGPAQYVFGPAGDTLNLSLSTAATQSSPVGSYAITAGPSALSTDGVTYRVVSTGTLAVTPASLMVNYSVANATSTYGIVATPGAATLTGVQNGDTVTATVGVFSGAMPVTLAANTPAGRYTEEVTALSNPNYTIASSGNTNGTLTIGPATLTYTASSATRTYGAANPTLSGTVAGFVAGDTQASATTGAPAFTTTANSTSNVGSYAINGGGLTASNYVFVQAAANTTALSITPATLTYVANSATGTYGAPIPSLTGTVTGFVNGQSVASATTGTPSFTTTATPSSNVGNYAINGSGLTADNGNYVFAQAPANATALSITPATLIYLATAPPPTAYGAPIPPLTGTVTGFRNTDTLASATTGTLIFTTTATQTSNVGSYPITGSGLTANHGNYVFVQAPGNATAFTIGQATAGVTYSVANASSTYGTVPTVGAVTLTGLVNGDNVTATVGVFSGSTAVTLAANTPVGSYTEKVTALSNPNYKIASSGNTNGTLTIDPATLTYVATAASRTYGATNPTLTGNVTGLVNGETLASATTGTLTFNTTATPNSNVGSYGITGGGLAASNYVFVQASANAIALTITPAPITVTTNSGASVYGTNATPGLTVAGLQNGQGVSVLTGLSNDFPITNQTNVGTYTINLAGTLSNPNYVVAKAIPGTWTVNPATLTYVATPTSNPYGAAIPTLNGTVTGFVNGQTIASATAGALNFTTTATSTSNAGSYPVTGGGLTANHGNYVFTQASGNNTALTITQAAVGVTYSVADAFSTYGTVATVGAAKLTGVVNGDTVSATVGVFSGSTPVTLAANTPVGSYTEKVTALSNPNYTIASSGNNTNGTLTINPATLTYMANSASRTYGAANPTTLTGIVSGFVNGESLASATTGTLNFTTGATVNSNVGSYAIAGGGLTAANYVFAQAPANASALTVTPAPITVTALGGNSTYGGSPSSPGLTATGLQNGQTASVLTGLGNSFGITNTTNAGSYTLNATGTLTNGNYTVTATNPGTWTVSPATLTYAATPANTTYGASTPALTGTVTGLVNGQTLASVTSGSLDFTTSATPTSNVGTYAITGGGLSPNNGNYVFAQAPANNSALTIAPATLTIMADPASTTAGSSVPALTGTVTGFVNGQTLASATNGTLGFSTTATPGSNPGSYPVTGGGLAAENGNYVFVQAPTNFVALTITPPASPGNYGVQQTAQFTPPPITTINSSQPVFTLANLPTGGGTGGSGTGGNGNNGGGGNNGNNGGNGNNSNNGGTGGAGSLANGRQGGNGAPPGVRLIDMPIMPLPPGTGLPPLGEARFSANEIVLQFGPNVTQQQIDAMAQRFGLTIVATQPIGMLGRTIYTFRLGNGQSVREAIQLIEAAAPQLGAAVQVQPNYSYGLTQAQADDETAGDPAQYVIEKFHLAEAHRITRGNNVIVAVIDSAIDVDHPDLAGVVTGKFDAGCGASAPDAHGTGMTGAIASHAHLLGVAPNAKIIAICAFGGDAGNESTSIKIINGLDYAIRQGARIVNMSFAGPRDPALSQALQVAREKGILLIGAAGNAGPKSPPLYPGADPSVLAVTAVDDHDRLFARANQGKYVAVAAPGVDVLVPAPNEGIQLTTGTSVATAHVSGVAALLIAQKPSRTPEEIRTILMSTAKDLGPKGVDPQFGAGLVDPLKALRLLPVVVGQKQAAAALAPAR